MDPRLKGRGRKRMSGTRRKGREKRKSIAGIGEINREEGRGWKERGEGEQRVRKMRQNGEEGS